MYQSKENDGMEKYCNTIQGPQRTITLVTGKKKICCGHKAKTELIMVSLEILTTHSTVNSEITVDKCEKMTRKRKERNAQASIRRLVMLWTEHFS